MNRSKLSVSVIVPIYNVEKYIGRCVRSLFEQTLDDIEYIFVNDCTPDRSMDILRSLILEYPARANQIKIVEHNKNQGLAAARNSGLKVAVGEYIIHCDSDDWVENEMYEVMYNKAKEESADIVICDYYAEFPRKQIYNLQEDSETPALYLKKILQGCLHNSVWNKLIKKDLYDHLSFWWKEGVDMWEDVSIVPRLVFYARKIVSVHQAFYHYSQLNINAYTQTWRPASLKNVVDVVEIINSFFKDFQTNLYEEDLLYLELRAKYNLLQYASKEQRDRFRVLYPETINLIFKHPAFSVYNKFVMWGWMHCWDCFSNIILMVVSQIKKYSR